MERDLNVSEQRPPGRRINRLRSNIEFAQRSEVDNENLVADLWVVTEADEKASAMKKAVKTSAKKSSAKSKKM